MQLVSDFAVLAHTPLPLPLARRHAHSVSDGTGMLTKQGVKEALTQMGMDSSEASVDAVREAVGFSGHAGSARGGGQPCARDCVRRR